MTVKGNVILERQTEQENYKIDVQNNLNKIGKYL